MNPLPLCKGGWKLANYLFPHGSNIGVILIVNIITVLLIIYSPSGSDDPIFVVIQ